MPESRFRPNPFGSLERTPLEEVLGLSVGASFHNTGGHVRRFRGNALAARSASSDVIPTRRGGTYKAAPQYLII